MRKTVTLTELLLATVLLGVILLTVGAFEVFSLRIYRKQDYSEEILLELTFITQHLNKYIRTAIGDKNDLGIEVKWAANSINCTFDSCYVDIRSDVNITPSDYSDDKVRRYAYDAKTYELRFYPDYEGNSTQYEVLSKRVVDCKFSFDNTTSSYTWLFRILNLRYNLRRLFYKLRFYPEYKGNSTQYKVMFRKVGECPPKETFPPPQLFKIDILSLRYNPEQPSSSNNPEVSISSINLFSFSHSLN